MARAKREKDRPRNKRPRLRVFFLEGELYRVLEIVRGKDRITVWSYIRHKAFVYNYSDVLKRHEKAFTTGQVMKILNRDRITFQRAWSSGMLERPQMTYSLDERRKPYQYMWSEKDILTALEYFASVHQGRPRKDGQVTSAAALPTPREVRAMIHDEEVLYVKSGDQFIPSWRAKEF